MKPRVIEITCQEFDEFLMERNGVWEHHYSLSDLGGEYGKPRVETVWIKGNRKLRSVRFPNLDPMDTFNPFNDAEPCEHYLMVGDVEND